MSFQVFHFHDSERIFRNRSMISDVAMTTQHVFNALNAPIDQGKPLRIALDEMGWHQGDTWNIIAGHHFQFEGFKNAVALKVSLISYEFILEDLAHLQLAFDKGMIDAGLLLLTTWQMPICDRQDWKTVLTKDMDALSPTISLPVSVCLYELPECQLDHVSSAIHVSRRWRKKDLHRIFKPR